MKLLFAYFDCDSPEAAGTGRGLGEQCLNFSTEYDFAVRKELLAGNNGNTIGCPVNGSRRQSGRASVSGSITRSSCWA